MTPKVLKLDEHVRLSLDEDTDGTPRVRLSSHGHHFVTHYLPKAQRTVVETAIDRCNAHLVQEDDFAGKLAEVLRDRHDFRSALRHAQTDLDTAIASLVEAKAHVDKALDDEKGNPRGYAHEPEGDGLP